MRGNGCIKFFKRVGKSLVAGIIWPIASLISLPKIIAIYCNKEIQCRQFSVLKYLRIIRLPLRPPEPTIKKMKCLVTAKYKISVPYLRLQALLHVSNVYIILCFSCASCVLLIIEGFAGATPDSAFYADFWFKLSKVLACVPSIIGMVRTFMFPNGSHFLTACDEILYPLKWCCNKYPKRFIDPLILKANLGLGEIQNVNPCLKGAQRLALNKELEFQRSNIYIYKEAILAATGLSSAITNLVVDYTFPSSLIFSANKKLNARTLQNIEDKIDTRLETKEEEYLVEINLDDERVLLINRR